MSQCTYIYRIRWQYWLFIIFKTYVCGHGYRCSTACLAAFSFCGSNGRTLDLRTPRHGGGWRWRRRVGRAARVAGAPTRRPGATRATAVETSRPSRSPSTPAAVPRRHRCAARIRCRPRHAMAGSRTALGHSLRHALRPVCPLDPAWAAAPRRQRFRTRSLGHRAALLVTPVRVPSCGRRLGNSVRIRGPIPYPLPRGWFPEYGSPPSHLQGARPARRRASASLPRPSKQCRRACAVPVPSFANHKTRQPIP